ncbi:MAG: hypothetical protein HY825_09640 [Acidobacteria bacterium]|nr:hypothetical protein [Acidobacteriota bacterium]
MSNSPNRFRIVAVMACALALAVVATATEPKTPGAQPPDTPQASAQAAPRAVIVRDAQTGMLRLATAQELQSMAAEIDRLLARGPATPKQSRLADGSMSTVYTGNFDHGVLARRTADGTIEIGCFDEPGPAKAFLGLVPGSPAPAPVKGEGR